MSLYRGGTYEASSPSYEAVSPELETARQAAHEIFSAIALGGQQRFEPFEVSFLPGQPATEHTPACEPQVILTEKDFIDRPAQSIAIRYVNHNEERVPVVERTAYVYDDVDSITTTFKTSYPLHAGLRGTVQRSYIQRSETGKLVRAGATLPQTMPIMDDKRASWVSRSLRALDRNNALGQGEANAWQGATATYAQIETAVERLSEGVETGVHFAAKVGALLIKPVGRR